MEVDDEKAQKPIKTDELFKAYGETKERALGR